MQYCPNAPEWQASHFAYDDSALDFSQMTYNQSELIWMAYWAGKRRRVLDMNMSDISAWNGLHRSGKSEGAATVGYLTDETFFKRLPYRIVNEPSQFMDEINYVAKNKIKGAYFQIDEAGVSMANSGWYELWGKTISSTIQIIGWLNPNIVIVAPMNEFVLSALRRMLNNLYNCSRYSNECGIMKPYGVQYSSMFRKYMYPRPSIKFAGQKYLITKMVMPKPPEFIHEAYTAIMNPTKEDKIAELRRKLITSEVVERKEIPFEEQVDFLVKNFSLFEAKTSNKEGVILDTALIRYKLDKGELPDRKARALKSEAEKRLNEKLRIHKEELINLEEKIKKGG